MSVTLTTNGRIDGCRMAHLLLAALAELDAGTIKPTTVAKHAEGGAWR